MSWLCQQTLDTSLVLQRYLLNILYFINICFISNKFLDKDDVIWVVTSWREKKAWLWRANWRARFGFQLGQFFNPPSWVEDAGAVSPSVLHIGSVCFLKIWNNEKSSNQSSFLRYLPLFWPAEQLRADVEPNLSQPQNTLISYWSVTALMYKLHILGLENEDFSVLVHELSVIKRRSEAELFTMFVTHDYIPQ